MDSLRGDFGGHSGHDSYNAVEDDIGHEPPPPSIGQDERRLQVRAYNHWASLLKDRAFPLIADLETGSLPDFDPYSVLLDFSEGLENPIIRYLGSSLAEECEGDVTVIRTLSDVPARSLLSRITDHYLQIHANQAPIGFEAEFVNQRDRTILYRGILLPFSRSLNSSNIDLIYGVINWKEMADQKTTDALLTEIDRVLATKPTRSAEPLTDWADGPADMDADILDLITPLDGADGMMDWPAPEFGMEGIPAEEDMAADRSLADWLASARELAQAAKGSEDRTRQALYTALSRSWDFALAAAAEPEDFRALLEDAGLTMQERAPYTPVVKLVFGADYDKTRLTEYATAMHHAQRLGLGQGELAEFLGHAPGGLKGVVHAERQLKREESGKPTASRDTPREALARKLRAIETRPLAEISPEGEEFTLVIARRTADGEVVLVGEVSEDPALLERAARSLIG